MHNNCKTMSSNPSRIICTFNSEITGQKLRCVLSTRTEFKTIFPQDFGHQSMILQPFCCTCLFNIVIVVLQTQTESRDMYGGAKGYTYLQTNHVFVFIHIYRSQVTGIMPLAPGQSRSLFLYDLLITCDLNKKKYLMKRLCPGVYIP